MVLPFGRAHAMLLSPTSGLVASEVTYHCSCSPHLCNDLAISSSPFHAVKLRYHGSVHGAICKRSAEHDLWLTSAFHDSDQARCVQCYAPMIRLIGMLYQNDNVVRNTCTALAWAIQWTELQGRDAAVGLPLFGPYKDISGRLHSIECWCRTRMPCPTAAGCICRTTRSLEVC